MAQVIPLFLTEDKGNTSPMACQRVFMDLNNHLDYYYDLEFVRLFRFQDLQFFNLQRDS